MRSQDRMIFSWNMAIFKWVNIKWIFMNTQPIVKLPEGTHSLIFALSNLSTRRVYSFQKKSIAYPFYSFFWTQPTLDGFSRPQHPLHLHRRGHNTLGCAMSHRRVYEKILAERWPCAMIFVAGKRRLAADGWREIPLKWMMMDDD